MPFCWLVHSATFPLMSNSVVPPWVVHMASLPTATAAFRAFSAPLHRFWSKVQA